MSGEGEKKKTAKESDPKKVSAPNKELLLGGNKNRQIDSCAERDRQTESVSLSKSTHIHSFLVKILNRGGYITWFTVAAAQLALLIGPEREHVTWLHQHGTVIGSQAHVEHAVLGQRFDGRGTFLAVHLKLNKGKEDICLL